MEDQLFRAQASGGNARILVVEDDDDVRYLVKEIVERLGYDVQVARSARKALMIIEQERVDLMLLDLNMPGGSGLDLLKAMHRRGLKVSVIVVSAYVSASVARQLLELGVEGVVAKPFRADRLVNEVQKVMQGGGQGLRLCMSCGQRVDPEDHFCRRCGHNLQAFEDG